MTTARFPLSLDLLLALAQSYAKLRWWDMALRPLEQALLLPLTSREEKEQTLRIVFDVKRARANVDAADLYSEGEKTRVSQMRSVWIKHRGRKDTIANFAVLGLRHCVLLLGQMSGG